MNTTEPTREQKLEAALTQLIQLCATLRYRQRRWKEHFGATNRKAKETTEAKMDQLLKEMGVDEFTEFKSVQIKFLRELAVEEVEVLSKNLIK